MSKALGLGTSPEQYRPLGLLAMAGGAAYVAAGIIVAATDDLGHPAANVLSVVWAVGALCGLAGIGLLGATGRGVFGRVALGLPVLAYTVLALDFVLITAGAYVIDDSPLFAFGLMGTLLGMVLLGIGAARARRWEGWRRFSPFVLLLVIPLGILSTEVLDFDERTILPGLAWIVIGYAVWSTSSVTWRDA